MPENNFMFFNEAFKEIDTMNDSEYQAATQRQKGVASGVADRRLHNKFYRQASIMVKSLANFIEAQGQDATDDDESVLLDSLQNAFSAFIGTLLESHDGDANAHAKIRQMITNAVSSASSGLSSHNMSSSAHSAKFAEYLKLSTGGTVAGPTTFKSSVTMQAASTIPTQPTSSNNTNIANTAFVKAALSAFLTDRNFIKAVMDAIGSETLSQYGVKYNFDNPNAWSISLGRLFGGLILQQINKLWQLNTAESDGALILLYTGMRCGELLNLRRRDINLKSKYLTVTKSKTKAGEGRIIPIHKRIQPIIESRCSQYQDRLFPISYTNFAKHFSRITNGKHTTHDCRHTVATMLDSADANPNAVRAILGHKNGDITDKVYTHKGLRDLRRAINLLK